MVIVDADARIVLVNAQTEALFGYHRSELIGQLVELLVPERFAGMHVGFRSGYLSDPHGRWALPATSMRYVATAVSSPVDTLRRSSPKPAVSSRPPCGT